MESDHRRLSPETIKALQHALQTPPPVPARPRWHRQTNLTTDYWRARIAGWRAMRGTW